MRHSNPPPRPVQRRAAKLLALAQGALLAAVAGAPALADDTEIFQTQLTTTQSLALKPNVLYIIDTSGSMDIDVDDTLPFDTSAALTYRDGGAGTCLHTRVYWSLTGAVPNCATAQFFELSKLRCDAAADQFGVGGAGVFQGRVGRFQTATLDWRSLGTLAAEQNPPHVECKADRGVHGESAASTKKFATNGLADPWRITETGEIDWEALPFYTLYSGKYMNYSNNPPAGTPDRLTVVKAATKQLAAINRHNINAGLMRFDSVSHAGRASNAGGPVVFPIAPISTDAQRNAFQAAVDALTAGGSTPLSETLYEATLYWEGKAPFFGLDSVPASAASSMSGGKYISPITLECQKNHIVYLTDGDPTSDTDAITEIVTLLNAAAPPALPEGEEISDTSCSAGGFFSAGDNCLDELAEYLAKVDHNTGLTGHQPVNVYTIGFHTDQVLLDQTAEKGNGEYFQANNALQLNQAFLSILSEIQQSSSTFSAPTVSVNAFNRITNRDELFFSLFTPSNKVRWPGNIKRFQLACAAPHPTLVDFCADGPDADSDPDAPIIVDADGLAAVDATTGFFRDTSRSVWTDPAAGDDGAVTELGGTAQRFGGFSGPGNNLDDPPTPPRKVFTYTGTYVLAGGRFLPADEAVLSAAVNAVADGNTALTAEVDLLPNPGPVDGFFESFFYPSGRDPSSPSVAQLVKWTRGIDVLDTDTDGRTTDARHEQGDSLHAKPVLMGYGPSEANPDLTLFSINNDGYLIGVDVDNGAEVFSFIPQELLSKVVDSHQNPSTTTKSHRLDGGLTLWFNDANGNGILNTAAPDLDHVYLVFGQRRGGNRYIAVDATDRANPELLWKIEGGIAGNDFAELGQTWSTMTKARIKLNGTELDVFVFGGGYDITQDGGGSPTNDAVGRSIFMVNARTGELVWRAGTTGQTPSPSLSFAKMTNSFPGDVRIFDITGDGLADRMYVADTRGQLWRFDIHNDTNTGASTLVTGTVFAELQKDTAGATPGAVDNRRFYTRPDVTLATPEDAQPFLAVTLGSGYRAHPLSKAVEDRIYMIRDPNIGNVTTYAPTITEEDLANLTDNLTPDREDLFGTPTDPLLGWMIELQDASGNFVGEKVLADPLVFNNVVLFTTFTPPTNPLAADCTPNQGDGRIYAINLFDGSPVLDLDQSGGSNFTKSDRSLQLLRSGIPPNVVILFSKLNGVVPVAFVAAEKLDMAFSDAPVKTYWFQQEVK